MCSPSIEYEVIVIVPHTGFRHVAYKPTCVYISVTSVTDSDLSRPP